MNDTSYREIPLSKGKVAIVDADDYESLTAYRWYTRTVSGSYTFYACRCDYSSLHHNHKVSMHRQILGITDPAIKVDHINRNGLDNRRSNLRLCKGRQNQGNSKLDRRNTSGYRGVYRHQGKWCAQITCKPFKKYLGRFDRIEDAARAYDRAALEQFGEFAALNFPSRGEVICLGQLEKL